MSTTVTPPIINDPAGFVAQQYALLSPSWDTLTGKEKLAILDKAIPLETKSFLPSAGSVPGEETDQHAALMLSKYYILIQSEYNHDVAELLGTHEIFNEVPIS